MSQYSFITSFQISASVHTVWDTLIDFPDWPEWWKGVKKISTDDPHNPKVLHVSLGYFFYVLHLTFTLKEIRKNELIKLKSSGDLEGVGKFTLEAKSDTTIVTYYWDVSTTKPWMNLTAPLLRPFFEFSHNLVMKWFVHGLGKKLRAPITAERYEINKAPSSAIS